MEKIIIFDTTLRDGEQAPGFSMNPESKLRLATQLASLGVDVIEAGFPASSESDQQAVHDIARALGTSTTIAALARAHTDDVDCAAEALLPAERRRIHTFISVSDLHIEHKLGTTRERVLELARAAVRRARQHCDDVQLGLEDASRADPDFLCRVVEAAIAEGARTVDVADTVGYMMPWEFGDLIRRLRDRVPNIDQATIAVHCHDDLGLAVANSLAGLRAGARQVDCAINGIGERAGNAALEEIVMAVATRRGFFSLGSDVRTEELFATSKLLEQITGIAPQPNKAIVGANAFAHEAGIHQHGVLANPLTYEILTPQSVGVSASRLVMGKHSGRHALRSYLERGGLHLTAPELDLVFKQFKALAAAQATVSLDEVMRLGERVRSSARRQDRVQPVRVVK